MLALGAGALCQDLAVLAVIGHVNSNVSITASTVYAGCGLAMLTPMSSNPGVTDRGLPNVFHAELRTSVGQARESTRSADPFPNTIGRF